MTKPLHILLSNDDGVRAEGIQVLARALRQFAKVTVFAPDRNRSAASGSLTLTNPLRPQAMGNGDYCLNGTPADCVHLALNGFLKEPVDMVVSGINNGANLGDDVLCSGTVAAALEGRHLRLPAIAISLVGKTYYDTAGAILTKLIQRLPKNLLKSQEILNINVPDLPLEDIKGIKICQLGSRSPCATIIENTDPRGEKIYWIGEAGVPEKKGEGTDFHAVEKGYVSITPIQVDMTAYSSMDSVETWLETQIL